MNTTIYLGIETVNCLDLTTSSAGFVTYWINRMYCCMNDISISDYAAPILPEAPPALPAVLRVHSPTLASTIAMSTGETRSLPTWTIPVCGQRWAQVGRSCLTKSV